MAQRSSETPKTGTDSVVGPSTTPTSPRVAHVVGIGSSAGGLEALQELLGSLTRGGGTAYVIAQHLSPEHRSLIVDLLSGSTPLTVVTAVDGASLEPDVIAIGPPHADVTVVDNHLHVVEPEARFGPSPSVNLLFESLAKERGVDAVGVVLSGTGSDGAHGLRSIRAAGGLTLVQTPETARFDGRPQAAIALGGADMVADAPTLGRRLSTLSTAPGDWTGDQVPVPEASTLPTVLEQLSAVVGVDFSRYKQSTLQRQIRRRMAVLQLTSIDDYLPLLAADPDEVRVLARSVLVTVTSFFRDPDAFTSLRVHLEAYLAERETNATVRIWVPGCATGEEVYTIALIAADVLGHPDHLDRHLKILGTDLDESNLAIARQGLYPLSALPAIPESLRSRYIEEEHDGFRLTEALRECAVFARHNVTEDPPFPRIDVVSCRNTLIYFTMPLQERVVSLFRFSLRPGGLLLLGSAESLGTRVPGFAVVDSDQRLFTRTTQEPAIAARPSPLPTDRGTVSFASAPRVTMVRDSVPEQHTALLEALVRALGDPFLVLDGNHELVEVVGDVSPYCRIPQGQVTTAAGSFLMPELQAEARALFLLCRADQQPATGRDIEITSGRSVRLEAQSLLVNGRELTTLTFHPVSHSQPTQLATANREQAFDRELERLEEELLSSQDNLRRSLADLESANEQLEASSEELQAASEELQSSNEELEASNEELQATNEQLGVLNQQSRQRGDELQLLNVDLENIQASLSQGMVIVDHALCITRFTPLAVRVFGLLDTDIGKPLTDIPTTVVVPGLESALRAVVNGDDRRSLEAVGDTGAAYLVQVIPYVDHVGTRRSGAIITLTDMTESIQLRHEAQRAVADFVQLSNSLDVAVWKCDRAMTHVDFASERLHAITGWSPAEVMLDIALLNNAVDPIDRDLVVNARAGAGRAWSITYRMQRRDGRRIWIRESGTIVDDRDGAFVVGTLADVTEQREKSDAASELSQTFQAVFNTRAFGVLILSEDFRVILANDTFCQLVGYEPHEVPGVPAFVFAPPSDSLSTSQSEQPVRTHAETSSVVASQLTRRDGSPVWTDVEVTMLPSPIGAAHAIAIVQDTSELRERTERLSEQAAFDALTGLRNRRYFAETIDKEITASQRNGSPVALAWIDLDLFKDVNDAHGHEAGDIVLHTTAARLKSAVRAGDIVGRLGGDEFGILLSGDGRPEALEAALDRVVLALSQPIALPEAEVRVTCSVGVALYPFDAANSDELSRAADTAMYVVKGNGGDAFGYFSSDMNTSADSRREMRTALADAIANDDFELHYQPIVSAADGRVEALESLLRWRRGDEVVTAGEFIPFCEESGQIRALGTVTFGLLRADLQRLRSAGLDTIPVAVNMSVPQLADPSLIELLSHWPAPSGLEGIIVEVVESIFLPSNERAMTALRMLVQLGATVSIDDYGCGYSNLVLLATLDPAILKIDKSLLHAQADDDRGQRLFRAAVTLGHSIDAQVVAEGVETPQGRELAVALGADLLQGFGIARPMPVESVIQWIASSPGR